MNRSILILFIAFSSGCLPYEADLAATIRAATGLPPSPEPTLLLTAAPSPTKQPAPATITPAVTENSSPIAAAPSATELACRQEPGRVDRHTLPSGLAPNPWEFRVYTPPCYDQDSQRMYPLLVLIHGSTYNDDQWDRLGADETADLLIRENRLAPFLILMPRDRVWSEPEDDPFDEALVQEILPWVETSYRAGGRREDRAIGGLSRGASWAVHIGLSQWQIFGAIGAHSLPMFIDDPNRIQSWLDDIPVESLPRLFLDIGEKDYLLEKALWFESLLTERNIPHEWYLYPGRHEESYWQSHLEQYLLWYAAGW